MTAVLTSICWAALAALHLLPAAAIFRRALIESLYGVAPGAAPFLLIHHRAALFCVVVIICLWALVRPEVRPLATVATGISMISFLVLYGSADAPPVLRTIAIADLLGLPFLAFAAWQAIRAPGGTE